jgi:hypothetical protein
LLLEGVSIAAAWPLADPLVAPSLEWVIGAEVLAAPLSFIARGFASEHGSISSIGAIAGLLFSRASILALVHFQNTSNFVRWVGPSVFFFAER